jgi:hypothetical protein
MKREGQACILRARRTGVNSNAIKVERDALKRETEKLQRLCKDVSMLKVQLNIVREECDKMKRQRYVFVPQTQRAEANLEV